MNTKEKKYTLKIIVVITVIIVILGLWFATWFLGYGMDDSKRGTLGDMFGSVNALYSGLALAGIIFTFFLQREDLKQTRKEFEIQNKTLHYQRFETTLFNLLSLHQKIVGELIFKEDNGTYTKGRSVFRHTHESKSKKDKKISFNEEDDLGHYFRNIYRIIKFIDTSKFNEETGEKNEEKKYQNVKFLREQLSTYEQILICYWGMSKYGQKLPYYIVKYSLLKNIYIAFKDNTKIINFYRDIAIKENFEENQAFIVKEEYRKIH